MPPKPDPRIDAYIARSAPFARPILVHIRQLVHQGFPGLEETIKWNFPSFTHNGAIVCFMVAFKAHCSFGFWHQGVRKLVAAEEKRAKDSMGQMGRITKLEDLPDDKTLLRYLREAKKLSESGVPARPPRPRGTTKKLPIPKDLAAALAGNASASDTFAGLSPSHRNEYVKWITEAKRSETRQRRIETAIGWLADGKPRNWKYGH